MIRQALLAAILLVAAAVGAAAQVQISAQTNRTNFLLYERIDLIVTLTNIGNNDLELNNDEGRPWLSFMVMGEQTQHNFLPVHSERRGDFAPMLLKMGQTKTLRVNLTPLYTIRAEGNYKASAVIDLPGEGQIVSDPVPFTVERGHDLIHVVRMVDTLERVYSLIRFSPDSQTTNLYLRVEAPSENTVYANLALGPLVSSVDPKMFFDPQGNVHVLQPMFMGTYLYTRADPDGKVLDQRIFKTVNEIRPQLVKIDDGNVIVQGGLSENPNQPRERLSDSQRGEKIMAPVSPEDDVRAHTSYRTTTPSAPPSDAASASVAAGPPPADAAPAPVGDPGTVQAPAAASSSTTDMPPAK